MKKGNATNTYNHCSNSSNNDKGYVKPKPIGAGVHKPKPDSKTPSMGKGMANTGGNMKHKKEGGEY